MKINISWSENLAKDFTPKQVLWKDLYTLTWMDLNYTGGRFENGHRKIDNWRGGNNCLIFDIDDKLSLEDAFKIIQANHFKALVITTKSHQKDKNGVVCDRYRIILPFTTAFYKSVELYKAAFIECAKWFQGGVDMATKDPSRFFYGNADQKHWYFEGKLQMWQWYTPVKRLQPTRQPVTTTPNHSTQEINGFVKWAIEQATVGNRNNILYRVYKLCEDKGLDAARITERVNNSLRQPLPEKEIAQITRQKR